MNTSQSKTVKIHAPDWFREPEFQAWYNRHLGRGLATWQTTGQKLDSNTNLPASECAAHAQALTDHAWNADVFYQPNKTFSDDYEAELASLEEMQAALHHIIEKLKAASQENGLDIEAIHPVYHELYNDVIMTDPFFDPGTDDERVSVKTAQVALDKLYNALLVRINRDAILSGDTYADCFVAVEPQSPEGSDSEMPERYWDIVVREAHKAVDGTEDCHVIVWISPV